MIETGRVGLRWLFAVPVFLVVLLPGCGVRAAGTATPSSEVSISVATEPVEATPAATGTPRVSESATRRPVPTTPAPTQTAGSEPPVAVSTATAPPATPSPSPPSSTPVLPHAESPEPSPPPSEPTPTKTGPQAPAFSVGWVTTDGGQGIALTWEAIGERVSVCPLIGEKAVGCGCLMDLPLTGSHVIASSEIVGSYSGFQLTVEAAGIRTVRYAPLAVDCPAGTPAWFFEKGPGICPQNAPLHSFAAVQRFEHGLMIWLETLDEFYVLLDHDHHVADPSQGESGATSLCIIRGPLALRSGASADNRVPEEPPVGMYQPVSGFGLVWRGEVEGTGDIRAALGWALEREYGFETVTQCELPCGAHWNCYLQGPTGRVFHFYYQFHFGHYWEVTG